MSASSAAEEVPTVAYEEYPVCDCDNAHVAAVHCPECDEHFCLECDELIHARKKNRGHVREQIVIVEPEPEPVPCDSDPSHVAVMYCEDCEENFCADCDYIFHSRKKTVNHRRYEGARPTGEEQQHQGEEMAEYEEQEPHAQQQQQQQTHKQSPMKQAHQQQPQQQQTHVHAAAAANKHAAHAHAEPAASKATPQKQQAQAAHAQQQAHAGAAKGSKAASAHATSAAAATKAAAQSASPAASAAGEESTMSEKRVAEHKQAWNALKKEYCKRRYGVGHWLGLSTEDRKELAVILCQELLFNPQPVTAADHTTTVSWHVQSYWTTYEVDVECEKTTTEKATGKATRTVYRVHCDDSGRLADFECITNGVASGGCAIM